MKNKKILLILICTMSLFLITGCGKKEAITTKDFNKITEEAELIITDAKDQFQDKDYVKDASIASSVAGWQIEFYTFDSADSAKEMYSKNKSDFEAAKDNSKKSSYVEKNKDNYAEYTVTADGYYMHICRIDETVIYLKVQDKYQDEVKGILKNLGY